MAIPQKMPPFGKKFLTCAAKLHSEAVILQQFTKHGGQIMITPKQTLLEIPFLEFEGSGALHVENYEKSEENVRCSCTYQKKVVSLQPQNRIEMQMQYKVDHIYNEDCIRGMQKMPDECVDLVIADPPYWKVIGESWDYMWRTEEDYINWSKLWIQEVSRILRKGGTFYCFGYFRMLALIVPYLKEMGLELRQQIIIDKGMRSVSGRATKNYKMFPNVTESVLFIVKDNKQFIKPFLKERQESLGLSSKQINEALGVKSNGGGMWSIYTGKNVCEQFPTKELWMKLSSILHFDINYEKVAQTFNAQMGFTDVWTDIDFYCEKRFHPTQKPLKLITRLVSASSNEWDLVFDPFSGAGSTQLAAIKLNRHYMGFELDNTYFTIAKNRIKNTQLESHRLL